MKHRIWIALAIIGFTGDPAFAQTPPVQTEAVPRSILNPRAVQPAAVTPAQSAVNPRSKLPAAAERANEQRGISLQDRITEKRRPFTIPVAPSLAAVYQPLGEQVEVFGVDPQGVLKDVWKHHNGYWEAAFNLSGPGFAPAGAPLAAIWYPSNQQLEVFTIAMNGALTVTYKAHNQGWSQPQFITPPGFAPPGAHVAAVYQPLNDQLEVFAIDASGAVKIAWKVHNGRWQGPGTLTPPGIAPAGAPLTAVWQPLNEQLEVFFVDNAGALRGVWKQHNAAWAQPFNLSAAGFLNPRANLASVWQPLNEQLEVFAVDRNGAINVIWKAHNGRWFSPTVIGGPGIALAGADIVALWDPQESLLQVATVGVQNRLINTWKVNNGAWKPGPGAYSQVIAAPSVAGTWPLGAALAGVVRVNQPAGRREFFTVDDEQAVRVIVDSGTHSAQSTPPRITTENFGPIYGAHAAACSTTLRNWSNGDDNYQSQVEACIDFMGIKAHCDRQDAFVSVGYPPQAVAPRYLQCTSRSHPDNVIEQAQHIAVGVAQGLRDAAIATVVYSPEIVQGTACINGVVFACASLAVDLASRAITLPPEIADAIDLARFASACVDGDIVSCAKLGAAGARAVGIPIPGEEAGQVALLTQQCLSEDYAACLRLGEKAAMAAGVPLMQINEAAANAQNCYAGDVDACIALGRQAAKAGIPVGGVANGANNLRQCSYGSLADCQQLGQAIAAIPR